MSIILSQSLPEKTKRSIKKCYAIYPKNRWLFVTIAPHRVVSEDLEEYRERQIFFWNDMDFAKLQVKTSVMALEVSKTAGGFFQPHLHALCLVNDDYFKLNYKITPYDWRKEFIEKMGAYPTRFNPEGSIDIECLPDFDAVLGAFQYIIKPDLYPKELQVNGMIDDLNKAEWSRFGRLEQAKQFRQEPPNPYQNIKASAKMMEQIRQATGQSMEAEEKKSSIFSQQIQQS